jgi:hypothetical protein
MVFDQTIYFVEAGTKKFVGSSLEVVVETYSAYYDDVEAGSGILGRRG